MSEPKRLHPIAAVTNFFKQLKELIFPFIAFIIFGVKSAGGQPWVLASSVIVVVISLISGIIHWRKFTYRLESGELRIEHGLFVKKKRYIPIERIQSLDLSESLLHRPFGLVKVKVETAAASGISEAEAVLTAITKDEANRLQEIITQSKSVGRAAVTDDEVVQGEEEVDESVYEETIYRISPKELLILATTSGGVGVVISAVFAFLSQFDEIIPYERVFQEFRHVVSSGVVFVAVIVLIGFLLAWVLALVGTMLKYAHFTVKRTERNFIISSGLLEKRQITIPLTRIQAIRMSENWLRQPFKLCSVYLISAGGSAQNADSSKVLLLPVVPKKMVTAILSQHLPQYNLEPTLHVLPKRALGHYVARTLLLTVPIVLIAVAVFKWWGLPSLFLMLLGLVWCYLTFKDAGWKVEGKCLTMRYRGMVRHTMIMSKRNIQSAESKIGFIQRKSQLATFSCHVKSGAGAIHVGISHMDEQEAARLYQWYSYGKKAPM